MDRIKTTDAQMLGARQTVVVFFALVTDFAENQSITIL
jgi:hypothetical protein